VVALQAAACTAVAVFSVLAAESIYTCISNDLKYEAGRRKMLGIMLLSPVTTMLSRVSSPRTDREEKFFSKKGEEEVSAPDTCCNACWPHQPSGGLGDIMRNEMPFSAPRPILQ
jgi:hypothetical protein